MKKKLIVLFIVIITFLSICSSAFAVFTDTITIGSSGDNVVLVQQRLIDLGYLNFRPTGKYSDMSAQATRSFQTANGIAPDGQIGKETFDILFSDDAVRAALNPAMKRVSGPAYTGSVTAKGLLSSWESVSNLMTVDSVFSVQDYNTGKTFLMKRVGGEHSALVQTVSSTDYETYLSCFGGSYTWEHRPVLVTIGSSTYAASLFGMPNGIDYETQSEMPGAATLYFNNSKTDVCSLPDEEHILSILRCGQSQ